MTKGVWVDAYWTTGDKHKIVDVTGCFESRYLYSVSSNANVKLGAGNSFLGGLAAGIILSGDMYEGRECSSIPNTSECTYYSFQLRCMQLSRRLSSSNRKAYLYLHQLKDGTKINLQEGLMRCANVTEPG